MTDDSFLKSASRVKVVLYIYIIIYIILTLFLSQIQKTVICHLSSKRAFKLVIVVNIKSTTYTLSATINFVTKWQHSLFRIKDIRQRSHPATENRNQRSEDALEDCEGVKLGVAF